MNDVALERIAERLVADIRTGRQATFTTADPAVRAHLIGRVRSLLAGRSLEESPD